MFKVFLCPLSSHKKTWNISSKILWVVRFHLPHKKNMDLLQFLARICCIFWGHTARLWLAVCVTLCEGRCWWIVPRNIELIKWHSRKRLLVFNTSKEKPGECSFPMCFLNGASEWISNQISWFFSSFAYKRY